MVGISWIVLSIQHKQAACQGKSLGLLKPGLSQCSAFQLGTEPRAIEFLS